MFRAEMLLMDWEMSQSLQAARGSLGLERLHTRLMTLNLVGM